MDTKALRQKILDLAIRGKLVPQDPTDEPASRLLARIREEKEKLVKEGRLKAKDIKSDTVICVGADGQYYEKFADGSETCIEKEIPFKLPEGWAWSRLGSITSSVQYGLSNSAAGQGTHKLLRITDIQNGRVDWDAVPFTTLEEADNYLLAKDDIVFARTGATVGKSFLITETPYPSVYASYLIRIRLLDVLYPKYIYQFFNSGCYWKQITDKSVGTGQPNCNGTSLKNLFIPIPPAEEQKRITAKIAELLSLIEEIESGRTELLSVIRQARAKILDLAVRGRLAVQDPADEPASRLLARIREEKEKLIKEGRCRRDKKESVILRGEDGSYYEKIGSTVKNIDKEIPFDLPEGWAWSRGYSCFAGMENKKPQGEFFDYIDIDSVDNKKHRINSPKHLAVSKAPSRANRAVQNGSVLFSLVRPYLENIAIVEEQHAQCIASTGFYICNSNGAFYPQFMFYLMISGYVVTGLNQYMKGDNSPSISKDNIENWLYPIPPIEEQKRIVIAIERLFSRLSAIEEALS